MSNPYLHLLVTLVEGNEQCYKDNNAHHTGVNQNKTGTEFFEEAKGAKNSIQHSEKFLKWLSCKDFKQ